MDVAHHGKQRGNRREYILSSDADRMVYLDLLHHPLQSDPPSLTFRRAHGNGFANPPRGISRKEALEGTVEVIA